MKTYKVLYKNESIGEIKIDNGKLSINIDIQIQEEVELEVVNKKLVPLANGVLDGLRLLKKTIGAIAAGAKIKKFINKLDLDTKYENTEDILEDLCNVAEEIPGIEIKKERKNKFFSY